jgi:hypothetical protein
VAGKGGADMVGASALACSGNFLLRLAGCQRQDLVAEVRRTALAANGFCSCRMGARASRLPSKKISENLTIDSVPGRQGAEVKCRIDRPLGPFQASCKIPLLQSSYR